MKMITNITTLAALSITIALSSAALGASTTPPKPCSAPEYRQFDFWVGNWRVTDPQGQFAGTNDVTTEYGGCVIQEHWSGTGGDVGSSFNAYRASTRQWHQTWVDNQGQVLLLDGSYDNGVMTLSGTGTSLSGAERLNRIRWTRIDDDHVRQLWDSSIDSGKTWTVVFDGLYTRTK
ncbi:MAG TPA: hypothetical protein VKT51_06545 [Candidatus Eremiobacteraceae bacterium]|nr:hypothetical protein [Candidatus Eremiobacteraceae bacterium]